MPSTGLEVLALADRPDRAAVRERLVHGEVEAVVALLHRRPVERAAPPSMPSAAAGRALPRRRGRALLEEQQSTRPSEAASSVGPQPEAARPLRPASSCQRSTASVSCSRAPRSSSGVDELEQLGAASRAPRRSSSR